MILQRRKVRSSQRHSQHNAIFTADKDMGDFLRRLGHRLDLKPFSKQRLPRVGHFHPQLASICRVVETGINKWCGSTLWITVTFERFSNNEFAMA